MEARKQLSQVGSEEATGVDLHGSTLGAGCGTGLDGGLFARRGTRVTKRGTMRATVARGEARESETGGWVTAMMMRSMLGRMTNRQSTENTA